MDRSKGCDDGHELHRLTCVLSKRPPLAGVRAGLAEHTYLNGVSPFPILGKCLHTCAVKLRSLFRKRSWCTYDYGPYVFLQGDTSYSRTRCSFVVWKSVVQLSVNYVRLRTRRNDEC
jgi:hypothetical protein